MMGVIRIRIRLIEQRLKGICSGGRSIPPANQSGREVIGPKMNTD